uniref:Uncharacterized protein n=1 Tax=Rhizophora mucronata TaxID=61149 RepID=A0A2P2M5B6_RHIMU
MALDFEQFTKIMSRDREQRKT